MIRHHTVTSRWTDEGRKAHVSLPCEPWEKPVVKLAIVPQQPKPKSEPIAKPAERFVNHWSPEEVDQLLALHAQGMTKAEIAMRIGRTPDSVKYKLRKIKDEGHAQP